jgi:hypothetical protein
MKFRRIFFVVLMFLLFLGGVWYFGFDRNISLPSMNHITKIEVCQNDFKQRAQQISYIEEPPKIQKIYDFIEKRKKGWEPLLYSPPAAVVIANFYESDSVLFQLYLMKSSNFLIRNNDGAYVKSLKNEERDEFFTLLGVKADQLVLKKAGWAPFLNR